MSRMTRELANRVEEPLSSEKRALVRVAPANPVVSKVGMGKKAKRSRQRTKTKSLMFICLALIDVTAIAMRIDRFVSSGGGQVVFQGAQNIGLVDRAPTSLVVDFDARRKRFFTSNSVYIGSAGTTGGKVDEKVRAARTIRFPMSERIES